MVRFVEQSGEHDQHALLLRRVRGAGRRLAAGVARRGRGLRVGRARAAPPAADAAPPQAPHSPAVVSHEVRLFSCS